MRKTISLDDIEFVNRSELEDKKLYALEHSYDSFEKQLNSKLSPIAISCDSKPYRITNGRHRIYLAREKGLSTVEVECVR